MYQEFRPSERLSESVDTFWTYSNEDVSGMFKVLPDSCTDLIFDLNQSNCFLSGAMTRFQQLELQAQSHLFGIRFKSENFGSLSRIPLHEAKNLRIEFSEFLSEFNLSEMCELMYSKTTMNKLDIIEDYIAIALNKNWERRDVLIIAVAQRIRVLNGNVKIEDLAKVFHLSLRQLQRRFKHYIGLTIKEFSNIIRFENAIAKIKQNPELSLMQIAFNMGYCDHSHLNHDFKRISGENPGFFR